MGDKFTDVDCAAFGMLSQFVWNGPGSPFYNWIQSMFNFLFDICFYNLFHYLYFWFLYASIIF